MAELCPRCGKDLALVGIRHNCVVPGVTKRVTPVTKSVTQRYEVRNGRHEERNGCRRCIELEEEVARLRRLVGRLTVEPATAAERMQRYRAKGSIRKGR